MKIVEVNLDTVQGMDLVLDALTGMVDSAARSPKEAIGITSAVLAELLHRYIKWESREEMLIEITALILQFWTDYHNDNTPPPVV